MCRCAAGMINDGKHSKQKVNVRFEPVSCNIGTAWNKLYRVVASSEIKKDEVLWIDYGNEYDWKTQVIVV